MKIEFKYPISSFHGDVKTIVTLKDKNKKVLLKLLNHDDDGYIIVTHDKMKGEFFSNIWCIECFHENYEFYVEGLTVLDKIDIEKLSDRFYLNEVLDNISGAVLGKVHMIKSLFKPIDQTAEVYIGEDKKRHNLVIKLKYGNIKGLISIPDLVDDVIFVYNDGKRKAKIHALSDLFIELKYKDEKENISMSFTGDNFVTDPSKEINDYLNENGYLDGDKELVVDKDLAIKFANMFLTSNSFETYAEDVVGNILSKFKI